MLFTVFQNVSLKKFYSFVPRKFFVLESLFTINLQLIVAIDFIDIVILSAKEHQSKKPWSFGEKEFKQKV